jgi:hypothetical protein
MDYSPLTKAKFRKVYERNTKRRERASAAFYALATHGQEKPSEIKARLPLHPAVIENAESESERLSIESEGHRRFGPGIAWWVYLYS